MDPNANLKEQDQELAKLHAFAQKVDRKRLEELRKALSGWLRAGGFEPEWDAYPKAAKAYRAWRNRHFRTIYFRS